MIDFIAYLGTFIGIYVLVFMVIGILWYIVDFMEDIKRTLHLIERQTRVTKDTTSKERVRL